MRVLLARTVLTSAMMRSLRVYPALVRVMRLLMPTGITVLTTYRAVGFSSAGFADISIPLGDTLFSATRIWCVIHSIFLPFRI